MYVFIYIYGLAQNRRPVVKLTRKLIDMIYLNAWRRFFSVVQPTSSRPAISERVSKKTGPFEPGLPVTPVPRVSVSPASDDLFYCPDVLFDFAGIWSTRQSNWRKCGANEWEMAQTNLRMAGTTVRR